MAWLSQPGPPLEEHEDELQLKLQFAEFLARNPGKAREAAYLVFRFDKDQHGQRYFGRAMQAIGWEADPIVQEEIQRLRSDDVVGELHPTTDAIDFEILEAARAAVSSSDKAKLYELYLNARGRNTKGGGTTVNVDNRTQNVMAIPKDMTVEDAKAYFLQKQATRNAATLNHARAA